jgi:hypothetical protein
MVHQVVAQAQAQAAVAAAAAVGQAGVVKARIPSSSIFLSLLLSVPNRVFPLFIN